MASTYRMLRLMLQKTGYLICFTLITLPALAQKTIYVAPNNSGIELGTLKAPFPTLQKAIDYGSRQSGDITIEIKKGSYYINKAIRLDASYFKPRSLQIRAAKNEEVILSAGKKIVPHWLPFKNGIYVAKIDSTLSFERLYCNDELQVLARYPNFDSTAKVFNGTAPDALDAKRINKWANPVGGYVHALHSGEWGGFHYRITGRQANGQLALEGGWQNNRPSALHKEFRFVENIFEELDAPEEWYFDREKGLLYFFPKANTDLEKASFVVAQLKNTMLFKGTPDFPLKNISLQGISFKHNERSFMDTKEPLLRSDWTFYRGGVLLFDGTENCTIRNCVFEGVGGNAIVFSNYNKNNTVTGCHIFNIGASAVAFVGNMDAVRSPSFGYPNNVPYEQLDKSPGPKSKNYPQYCKVDNNLLHNLGMIEKQATGVQIEVAEGITISHNSIYNVPRAGINIGDGCFGGHIIEYNDVFNTVKETGDHGSFNSWGRDRFWSSNRRYMDSLVAVHPELILLDAQKTTIIRNNRWRCDHGWDVDLDDGSSNYHIYNNLFLNGGLKFREGFYRKAENNIMVNNSFHPHVWFKSSEDVFERNIVMKAYAPISVRYWGKSIDRNLFPNSAALEKARETGTDKNSMAGDPLFINPAQGDFRVSKNSPALKLGFKNFAMDQFGVQIPSLKKIALQAPIPKLMKYVLLPNGAQVIDFLGGKIKSVEGLGDRSAYGLPDATGVIIVNAGNAALAKASLQPKDVIRKADDKAIRNTMDLISYFDSVKNFKPDIRLSVVRGQQLITITISVQ